MATTRIAILHPSDPAGSVPSGIDSVIRGILKWSPPDLEYVLFGASSDIKARPLGRETRVSLAGREVRFTPLLSLDPHGTRARVPLTVRYLWALRDCVRRGELRAFDALDFHRIEPVWLFTRDARPKNLIVHQDMTVIRDPNSDIMWRHAPWLYEAIERRLMSSLDTVFSVRRSAVERYARTLPNEASKFRFIPTWVDTDVFKPATSVQHRAEIRTRLVRQLGVSAKSTLLVFVGRLDRQKDPLLLLQAFATARRGDSDLHLVLIGDGILRQQIEAEISARNLGRHVSLLGVQPSPVICDVLQASDLFVMSSAYEGMPIAVLEALATGLPVISTAVGEVPELIKDGVNGFLSDERTPASLALALAKGVENLRLIRGAPCVESVRPFQPQSVLGQLYDVHRIESGRRQAA